MLMVNDAALEGGDFKAHGLRGVKKQRYFIRTLSCEVGTAGSDVWSRTVAGLDGDWTLHTFYLNGQGTIADRRDVPTGGAPSVGAELALGTCCGTYLNSRKTCQRQAALTPLSSTYETSQFARTRAPQPPLPSPALFVTHITRTPSR